MKYIAGLALLLMALSIPGVNFYHHLSLPNFYADKISESFSVDLNYPFIHNYYDITLTDEIKERSMAYYDAIKVLRDAKQGDVVTFHLSGYGGSVQTTTLLINNIKTTKAHTIMIAESAVYSAHAYILLSGDEVIMKPYSYVMLHASSVLNDDCSQAQGVDRGVSNVEHCESFKKACVYQNVALLYQLKYITQEEIMSMIQGHDVYIQADEMNRRIEE